MTWPIVPLSTSEKPVKQQVRFCKASDGVHLAFSAVGSGPPLVKTANWLNHLEFDWQSPVWSPLFTRLSARHRLIRYDERGTGLSDRDVPDFTFEAFVRDLEAVVDTLRLDRFALLGVSQGAPVAIAYAVRHPERVSRLALSGGFAQGWRRRGNASEIARAEASIVLIREGWGQDNPAARQMFTSLIIADATREEMEWMSELERQTASAETAMRLLQVIGDIDVMDLLPQLSVPVLVLHSRGDARVPFEQGRQLAQAIPNARLVPLESKNHLILSHEPAFARFLDEMLSFLDEPDGDARRTPTGGSIKRMLYQFEDFSLDTDQRELRRGADLVPIEPQVFDFLVHLVRNRDRVVSKDDLIAAIWGWTYRLGIIIDQPYQCGSPCDRRQRRPTAPDQDLQRKGIRFVGAVRKEHKAYEMSPTERTGVIFAPPDRPSIAVLPFTNLSDDPEQQYFADAMTEEITVALGRVPRLFVIASSSAFTYKGRLVGTKQIGAELGVRYVLSGSVRKHQDLVRIIVELSDAASGNQVWADSADGTLDSVFELQDRVAASVSARIAPKIRAAEVELARRKPTHSSTAYDLYLRALPPLRDNLAQNEDLLRLLDRAIELDPTFAAAYGLAAWCYHIQAVYGWLAPSDPRMNEGLRLCHLAAETGENDPEALWMAGRSIEVLAGEVDYGLALVEKSLSINPNSANAWWASGMSYAFRGQADTAIEHFGRARRLNPLDPSGHALWMGLAHAHLFGDNYEQAKIAVDKALAQWPNSPPGLRVKAAVCGLLGRIDEGRSCVQQYLAVSPASNLTAMERHLELQLRHNPCGLDKYVEGLRLSGLPEV